jgi:hypothetical protein
VNNSAVTSTIDYQLKNLLSATNVHSTTVTATTVSAATFSGGSVTGLPGLLADLQKAAGDAGYVQFNAAGILAADSGLFWDNTNKRLGIGTTNPGALLDIYKSSGNVAIIMSGGSFGSDLHQILTRPNGAYGAGMTTGAGISLEFTSFNQSDPFCFSNWDGTTKTRLVTILNNGNVGIGKSPNYQLELSTDSAGKPSTNTWTIVSDERLKKNIQVADLDRCYDIVKMLPLKRFTWRDDVYTPEQVRDRSKLGWISQDVQSLFPKSVGCKPFIVKKRVGEKTKDEVLIEDCLDLNNDQVYAVMYGAIQKLIEKVEKLEIIHG